MKIREDDSECFCSFISFWPSSSSSSPRFPFRNTGLWRSILEKYPHDHSVWVIHIWFILSSLVDDSHDDDNRAWWWILGDAILNHEGKEGGVVYYGHHERSIFQRIHRSAEDDKRARVPKGRMITTTTTTTSLNVLNGLIRWKYCDAAAAGPLF